jgi:hypothetical protein
MYILLLKDKKRAQRDSAEKTSKFGLEESIPHKLKIPMRGLMGALVSIWILRVGYI